MSKLTRAPYVLAHLADAQGCGFHRILRPLEILSRNGICAGRAEMSFFSDETLRAINPSVVVFQRQLETSQIETIRRYRTTLPNTHFVYEIDDILSAVPDYSYHAPYMTPNVDAKIAAAASLCDVITVTTEDLAAHMRSILPADSSTEVRVAPNMLGRDDLDIAAHVRVEAAKTPALPRTSKLRIGWGGGIGHAGDLALLHDAMRELSSEVEWVFLGMNPDLPDGVVKHFAGGVVPQQYLAALAALNVDLIVAPLVDNAFNRCKSNLRLLEAAACSYPVIASPVAPYRTKNPPLFAEARSTADWVDAIRRFAALPLDIRAASGAAMNAWLREHYVLDDDANLRRQMRAWLPRHVEPFIPKLAPVRALADSAEIVQDLSELRLACATGTRDVLYLRPDVAFNGDAVTRLLATPADVVVPISNDGGPWGFPSPQIFTLLDDPAAETISRLCLSDAALFSDDLISLNAATGPVVLLRRRALDAVGSPDFDSGLSPEVAILEWSVAARSRGLTVGLTPRAFAHVRAPQVIPREETELAGARIANRWPASKLEEAPLTALRERLELLFHREHFRQLPPPDRTNYSAWAAACDTRGPKRVERAVSWLDSQESPPAIEIRRYPCRVESPAEWTFFAPDGADVPADLIPILAAAIQASPDARIFYGDNDFKLPTGQRISPDFKPNFDLFMLLSRDYVSQAILVHGDALAGLEDITSASLFDLVLRTADICGRSSIGHIPRILATLEPPVTPEAAALGLDEKLASVERFLSRNSVTVSAQPLAGLRELSFASAAAAAGNPPVAIIIPCKDNLEMLAPCVATLLRMTDYPSFRIFIVDNGSTRADMLAYQETLHAEPRVTLLSWPHPYNWSALNNWAIEAISCLPQPFTHFVFLNDDTRVISPAWLSELVGASLQPNVGPVGAKLSFPHGLVQHVGVFCDRALTGHIHKGLPLNNPGTNGYAAISHEATAVTGACMLVSAEVFTQLGGFDESLPHNFNDVEFCLRARRIGLVSVVAARAELQHFEGVTRNAHGLDAEAMAKLTRDGERLLQLAPEPDPYWNPNLAIHQLQNGTSLAGVNLNLYAFPPPALPWPEPPLERILCVGPANALALEFSDGAAVFQLEVSGNLARIAHPPMACSGPWDLREPSRAREALALLGIDRIVLTAIGEAPLQLLSFLRVLDLPIIYRPLSAEAACPRTNLRPNGEACDAGFRRPGFCQACVDSHSSPHGNVIVPAWHAEWARFFSASQVEADLTALPDPDFETAIKHVFIDGFIDDGAEVETSSEESLSE